MRRCTKSAVSILIMLAVICPTMVAAPQVVVGLASEWKTSFLFWLDSSGVGAKVGEWVTGEYRPSPLKQEGQEERDMQVARVQLYPGDVTVKEGQTVHFAAVAYDYQDATVGGIRFEWSARDAGRDRTAHVSRKGGFKARMAGTYTITAEAAGRSGQVTVTVTEGERPAGPGQQPKGAPATRPVSSRDLPPAAAAKGKEKEQPPPREEPQRQSAYASARRTSKFDKASLSHAPSSAPAAPLPLPEDSQYDDGNYWSADDPGNQVGDPPGGFQDGGAGSGNFQLAAPVLSLPGRGIDLALGLTYNSRLWNKAGSEISYDIDKGWPAPGWNLGFGKMLGLGINNGGMIVEPDGTRHPYAGTVTFGPNQDYTDFVGHTTDGTFIDYSYHTGLNGVMSQGFARYPNGTEISYTVNGTGGLYPSQVTDAQGNFVTITYLNNTGPQIQTITDTLGRVVTFHYDANNLLTAITAPGLTSGTTRTLVRLHYKQLTLNYAFSGLTPRVSNATPWVIDAVYYPATATGYWFNDTDSYSSYGMIARVREQRGMTHSATGLTVQGTMTKGTESSESAYNYTLTPNASLTDAPTYTSRTDTWDGMDTAAAVTTYSAQPNATPRRTEVVHPSGAKSVQLAYNAPGQFNDGLIYQEEVSASGNAAVLQKSVVTWEAGAYGSARPARLEMTDERLQKKATEFDYGTVYNQLTETRDYDYGGLTVLRITRTQYENSSNYTTRHIFNLPKQVEVFAANGTTRLARTEYTYDAATLVDAPMATQHLDASNPYAYQYWVPEHCYPVGCGPQGCGTYCEPGHYESAYRPETDYRGNVTQTKTYADAAGLTNPITETRTYDITGNVITTSPGGGETTSYTYASATQFGYPTSQTRGSATDATKQVTTSTSYSFNTGLVLSTTDANGRTTQNTYFATNLRPQKITLPSGAYTLFAYDDAAMNVTQTSYLYGGAVITAKNVKRLNGLGRVSQEEALTREAGVDYWDVVETMYDSAGRVWKQSLPYRSGQTPQWSETAYDVLDRVVKNKAPDGSETKAVYNDPDRPVTATTLAGQTVRTTDAWGRERWGRSDAFGRLVEVIEPDPLGNGLVQDSGTTLASAASLVTKYTYDLFGNLTLVTQGSQTRKFKYDSLGRLTHQKLAEASAMLTDAGAYVATGGLWSEVLTYDARSNVATRMDARGAKTTFNYNSDPLNRLQSVSYDTTADPTNTVLDAPTVTFTYMTAGDLTRADTITTAGVSTEDYDYDTEGRVNNISLTLNSRPSYPMEVDYTYDTLDRVSQVRYPAQYGVLNSPRKVVVHEYDVASRMSGVKYDGAYQASSLLYNPASQVLSLKVGAGTNQITESYTYEALTGLLSNQKVQRGTTTLMDLSYDYLRTGTTAGRTGQLTKITNNLDAGRNRAYEYDALGRLQKATGSSATPWSQTYTYDRYGNRLTVTAAGNADNGTPVPRDGFATLAYGAATNRISTAGWQYDAAGNQTRAQLGTGGVWQRYQYDAAGRLAKVTNDAGTADLAVYTYGASNQRLISTEGTLKTYYAWAGESVLAEYMEGSGQTVPQWAKSNVYLEGRLLSTVTPGATAERVEYQHPDRLGTRLVTNNVDTTSFEQTTLPFGTALDGESTGATDRRFTSYDRSATTGLDYAVNRSYDARQGRFTQVDPIGMRAASLDDPQSLNMYAYCGNDPVNRTDANGLFWGKLWRALKTAFKWIAVAAAVVVAVFTVIYAPMLIALMGGLNFALAAVAAIAGAVSAVLGAFGMTKLAGIIAIIGAAASFGTSLLAARDAFNLKTMLKAISDGANLVSRILSAAGHRVVVQVLDLATSALNYINGGLKRNPLKDENDKVTGYEYDFEPDDWETYKFLRKTAEQVAGLAGESRLANALNVLGGVEDIVDLWKDIDDFNKNKKKHPQEALHIPAGREKDGKIVKPLNERQMIQRRRLWRMKTIQGIIGRINSIFGRVDKAIALAH